MRMRLMPIMSALTILAACQPAPGQLTQAERAEITAQVDSVVARLYAAMNAHDAERVLAHYLPTDEFLYVGVSDAMQGWNSFSAIAGPWYTSHPDVTFEYQVLHIQVLTRDAATITARGGSTEAPHLMWTRTLVRRDGAWLVALEHESWPGGEEPRSKHPMS